MHHIQVEFISFSHVLIFFAFLLQRIDRMMLYALAFKYQAHHDACSYS